MSELMIYTSKKATAHNPLASYWQTSPPLPSFDISMTHQARVQQYTLPEGVLLVLSITLFAPVMSSQDDVMRARQTALKAALSWHKQQVIQQGEDELLRYVLNIDIQEDEQDVRASERGHLLHHFGARYFIEELVIDTEQQIPLLQVFGWQDWQSILAQLPNPADIWQFLGYHEAALRASILGEDAHHGMDFENEQALLTKFLQSPELLTQAIAIDKTLIVSGIADAPNVALKHMRAHLTDPDTQNTLAQAGSLWSTLCERHTETLIDDEIDEASMLQAEISRQVLFDESLFSRHELVRTLYKHVEQPLELQRAGYVIHQHSYTRLGRHYMLIFYGTDTLAQHSREVIVPNLAKIAEDVAVRLPIDELSQVVVIGIDFIIEGEDTFVDMDVWVQPVAALSQNERRMVQKIKHLNAQVQKAAQAPASDAPDMPSVQLHYSVPPRS